MEGQTSCELPHSLNNLGKKGCKYISKVFICTPETQRISKLHAMMTNQYSILTYIKLHLTSIHIYNSKNTHNKKQHATSCHIGNFAFHVYSWLLHGILQLACASHMRKTYQSQHLLFKNQDLYWMPRDWESSWRAWLDVQLPPNMESFNRDTGALTWMPSRN